MSQKYLEEIVKLESLKQQVMDMSSMELFCQKYDDLERVDRLIVEEYVHDKQYPRWKRIELDGVISKYEVSNTGNIRNSKTGKLLAKTQDKDGYVIVGIYSNSKSYTKRLHRLIADAFIPNPENKPQVNHINGVKDFNWIGNLEWNTNKENIIHAYDNGLICYANRVSASAKYAPDQIHDVCKLLEKDVFTNIRISELTDVDANTVSRIKMRRIWQEISSQYRLPTLRQGGLEGDQAGSAVYTNIQIHEVCKCLSSLPAMTGREIEERTGVPIPVVWRVRNHLNWNSISKDYTFTTMIPGISKRIYDTGAIHEACRRMANKDSIVTISNDLGIKIGTLSDIRNGRTWKEISSQYPIERGSVGRARLTDDDTIHEICRLLTEGVLNNREIASRTNVLPGFVSSIKQRTHYTEISKAYEFKTASKEDVKNSVLTEPQVHEACKRMEKGETASAISKDLGVSSSCINALRQGRWGHITSQYNIQFDHTNGSVNSRETAIKVCELLSQNKYKNTEIAKMLDVKASFVSDIKQRKQWKDVGANYTWHLPSKPKVNVANPTVVKPGDVNPNIPVVKVQLLNTP